MHPDLVLDTNVYLEQVDLQDLVRDVLRGGGSDLTSPTILGRRARARASILLAWYFHKNRLSTAFNWAELADRMLKLRRIDVNAPGDVPTVVTGLIAYVVHERVLSGWVRGSIAPPAKQIVGTAADDDLLSCAQMWNVPLITNEGNAANGLRENKKGGGLNLRGKAKNLRVPVFTPQEYLDAKNYDGDAAATDFFSATQREFANEIEIPLASAAVVGRAKDVLLQLYHFVLFPEAA